MPDLNLNDSRDIPLRQTVSVAGSLHSVVDGNDVLLSTARLDDFSQWVRSDLSVDRRRPGMPDGLTSLLARSARGFHLEAGTFSPGVRDAIDRLERGAPVIEVAYQPNTLAGYNVVSQALVAQLAAPIPTIVGDPYEPVVLFRMLDYDEAGDQGIRSLLLPDVNRSTPLRLSGAVRGGDRRKIAMATPCPSSAVVSDWMQRIETSAVQWAHRLNKLRVPDSPIDIPETKRNAERIRDALSLAYMPNRSITTANSIAMSQLVNNVWGMQNIVFAPASSLLRSHLAVWPMIELARESLPAHDTFGIWRVCDSCFRRAPTSVTFGEEFGEATSQSTCCGREYVEAIGSTSTVPGPFGDIPKFVPRVGLCDLLDSTQFGFSATISYAGGIDHVKRSREAVFRRNRILQPDLLYDPRKMLTTKRLADVMPAATAEAFNRGKFPAALYSTWVPDLRLPNALRSKVRSGATELPALFS